MHVCLPCVPTSFFVYASLSFSSTIHLPSCSVYLITSCAFTDHLLQLLPHREAVDQCARLCESYFLHPREPSGRERVCPQLFLFVLSRALDTSSPTANAVKRVYALRRALDFIDFSDRESSETLRQLILQAMINPAFLALNHVDGVKFLSYCFNLDLTLAVDLYAAILPQVFLYPVYYCISDDG